MSRVLRTLILLAILLVATDARSASEYVAGIWDVSETKSIFIYLVNDGMAYPDPQFCPLPKPGPLHIRFLDPAHIVVETWLDDRYIYHWEWRASL